MDVLSRVNGDFFEYVCPVYYMVLAGSPAGLAPYCYRSVPMKMLRDVLKSTVFRGIQLPPVKHNIVICPYDRRKSPVAINF